MNISSLPLELMVFGQYPLFRDGVIDHITVTHTFDLSIIWIALFLYLLSYIFAYGEELQRQSDETL